MSLSARVSTACAEECHPAYCRDGVCPQFESNSLHLYMQAVLPSGRQVGPTRKGEPCQFLVEFQLGIQSRSCIRLSILAYRQSLLPCEAFRKHSSAWRENLS